MPKNVWEIGSRGKVWDISDAPSFYINETDGFIPVRHDQETLVDSALQETSTEIVSSKTIRTIAQSLRIGENLKLSDGAGFLNGFSVAFDNLSTFYTQNSIFDTQEEYDASVDGDGIKKPARFNITPARWQDTIPFEFETNTTNSITFPYVTETNLIVRKLRFRSASAVSNVRIVVERLQDDLATWLPVWESVPVVKGTWSGGYNLSAGETEIDLPIVTLGIGGNIFRATIATTESVLPLKGVTTDLGLGTAFYPFLMIYAQDWFFTNIPNEYDIKQDSNGKFSKESVLNSAGSVYRQTLMAEVDGADDQPDFSNTPSPQRDWGFKFTHSGGDASFVSLTFKSADAHTNVLCTLDNESTNSVEFEPVFTTIDVVAGDNTITFPQQAILKDGDTYNISIFAFDGNNDTDAGIALLTNPTQEPYFTYRIKPIKKTEALFACNQGYVEDLTPSSTNSTSLLTKLELTIPSTIDDGKYEIIVSYDFEMTKISRDFVSEFHENGVLIGNQHIERVLSSGNIIPKQMRFVRDLVGGEVYSLKFGVSNSSATATMSNAVITYRKIA